MGLGRYALSRILQTIPVLFGVVTLVFLFVNATPGDPVRVMLGPEADPETIERVRAQYGLDEPLHVRFGTYIVNVMQGDLGNSIHYGVPVTEKIAEVLPVTILLTVSGFAFAIAVSIPLGVLSARRRNERLDHVVRVISLLGVSTPSFWVGLILIILFSYHLNVLPATGLILPWTDPANVSGASNQLDVLLRAVEHLILPTIALGTLQMAAITRIQRSSMLEALGQEYVVLARAYGIKESTIVWLYAFRNAQLPVITIIGLNMATALGGSVLIEIVFNINGLGQLIYGAIMNHDMPLVVGSTLVFSLLFVLSVVIVDIMYAYIDPRVKYD